MENTWTPLPPSMFTVPQELKDQILSGLEYHDVVNLRQTCHAATKLVPSAMIKDLRAKLKNELRAEEQADHGRRQIRLNNSATWARAFPESSIHAINNIHANFFTKATRLNCYICLRKLPRECFTDAQAMGSRSLGHKDATQRFCKLCGVRSGIWEKGTSFKDAKQSRVLCRGCNSIQKADCNFKQAGVCSARCLERAGATCTPKDGEEHVHLVVHIRA
ncbi:hypothetical protein A1O3_03478 [Capronia epimyces CBS 606.96]|uniref:F-box domain-containing protein n=1 Tax=Capronia epimyces CBS 606.96 TaxID=1182542 RepID=W9Y144_9EURO|nr:uncharacterized protein A1O3_03478 [Capronia epimyces CBS 606.96]EXJ86527.1 hypothetical protein A1O3_03478 [Capronia epimyces CBS 606.96]